MPIHFGIIGVGAIGNYLIDKILESENFTISAVWDSSAESFEKLSNRIDSPPPLVEVSRFPSEVDVFVECASVKAVEDVIIEACKRGKTAIIASIGGLMGNDSLWKIINESNSRIILPSGAIGGLDILKALDKDDIESVSLTTRKHPRSLPNIALPQGATEIEIYNGTARDAIKQFPKNINVAAMLSLAGIGFDRTMVKIVADSKIANNIHEIQIVSKSGKYRVVCENYPFEINPATSKLAAQSIWAAIRSISEKVTYGI